jgi:hypothetical protein
MAGGRLRHSTALLGAVGLLASCAAVDTPSAERLAELRTKGQACNEALPDVTSFSVDHFGNVQVSARGPDAALLERNFRECVAAQGRWAAWTVGQPAPMLEPIGPDNPDPSPALRVP